MPKRQPTRRDLLNGAGAMALGISLPKGLSDHLTKSFPGLKQATLVPADKGLDPKWVKGLFERGKPTVYTGDELKWIGMPVGGICCGQVYVGGDGKLWYWDLYAPGTSPEFNSAGAGHYESPMAPKPAWGQRFYIELGPSLVPSDYDRHLELNARDFEEVSFSASGNGSETRYRSVKSGIEVDQEAWTPAVPLRAEDSAFPLVAFRFRVKNISKARREGGLYGDLKNFIGTYTIPQGQLVRVNRGGQQDGIALVELFARPAPRPDEKTLRPEIVFADFEGPDYGEWKVDGTAFGTAPFPTDKIPERQNALRPAGKGFVNSHESRHGEDSGAADQHLGKMTSPEFTITRKFVNFLIGGGSHAGKTCINLIVDRKAVHTSAGKNTVALEPASWDVSEFQGKKARIEIVDSESGAWGHITVDQIVFSDRPPVLIQDVTAMPDFGSMAIALLEAEHATLDIGLEDGNRGGINPPMEVTGIGPAGPTAMVIGGFDLAPGKETTFTFVLAWHFPNFGPHPGELAGITDIAKLKKHYAKSFKDAADVVRQFAKRKDELYEKTKLWVDTWYDSTLPYWFLERVYIPLNTLSTSTCWWLDNGRFYAFEGVECCAGTCQHVWNYAQSVARIFPELERDTRERVDYGIGFGEDGALDYRAEAHKIIAHDGQCGTIIRTYREHTVCPDDAFLRRIWPKVKKSVERMIQEDPNRDGVLEGWQYNTLDAAWKGRISWISSLYAAALKCGSLMAREMGDEAFAKECDAIVASANVQIPKQLFNGEYFTMERDASAPQSVGYGPGCHVDQVLGDSFLWQIGVPGVLPRDKVKTALKSLYKYNFAPDAGSYRNAMQAVVKGGRWYAMPGEAGLLMTTFPKGGAKEASGKGSDTWSAGYFNECMHGFEYQAAAHMFAEGLIEEGMTVIRSIHDRYGPKKRNPFNEIECGDHYARSMASYGAFLTLCGFSYHGPRGRIGFAPKLKPGKFKVPFTSAEGWGTYEQTRSDSSLKASFGVKFGRLRVRELTFEVAEGHKVKSAAVKRGAYTFGSTIRQEGQALTLILEGPVQVDAEERLEVGLR